MVPFLAEKTGRKAAILLGSFLMLLGTSLSIHPSLMLTGRGIIGAAVAILYLSSKILLSEISPSAHKRKMFQIDYAMWTFGLALAILVVAPFASLSYNEPIIFSLIMIDVLIVIFMVFLQLIL